MSVHYFNHSQSSCVKGLYCTLVNNYFFLDCPALNATDRTVQYSTEPSASGDFTGGTVATYSCADGYELVGEENRRTCLVDVTWAGAEPQCTG